jgi:dehydrogenase/reductase SDR family protein 4
MPADLFDLTGKVAIITGSSRGIGLASARRMAQHGAKVVISGRKADACAAAAEQINAECSSAAGAALHAGTAQAAGATLPAGTSQAGGAAIAVAANIGRREDLQNLVDTAVAHWGRVDIVMANAAIHPWVGSVLDLPDETFNKFMQVNVQSSIWLAKMTVPDMLARGYGRFIVVASIVGLLGDPSTGTYGLTKAADMQFVRNMAMEFAAGGICANCIAPGTFKTDMARSQWEDPEQVAWYSRRNPSRRFGELDEISGLAVLLASRAGGYINGQTIPVDGGHTISFR